LLTLTLVACTFMFTSAAWAQTDETTTTSEPATTTTLPPTTTTLGPVPNSGEPCNDSLSCQRIIARDLSRLRAEVLMALFLVVLLSAAALVVLVGG
jgi:hypothetical protein